MAVLLAEQVNVSFTRNITIVHFDFGQDREQYVSIRMADAVRIAKWILQQGDPSALAAPDKP